MNIMEDLFGGLGKLATDALTGEMTPEKRKAIAAGLKDWLANTARKKESMFLASYVAEFSKRIDDLCEVMEFGVVDGKVVVKVFGPNESTLLALQRGTNWFDPCDDVVSVMISALWKS